MKKITVLISIILIAVASKGQDLTGVLNNNNATTAEWNGFPNLSNDVFRANIEVVSKYDTVVLNKGLLKCNHQWAVKIKEIDKNSCLVYHDASGCPNNWKNDLRICTECLRHERIIETRTTVDKGDKYQEALNRLNNK